MEKSELIYMQFSTEKYEKQSSYVIQSTEYNNLLHAHNVRVQSEKLLKGVNIHGLTLRLICLLFFDPLICSYFPPIFGSRFTHCFNACMVELK